MELESQNNGLPLEKTPEETSSFNNATRGVLALLAVVALVLGYVWYQKMTGVVVPASPDSKPQNVVDPFDFPPLSEDEQTILNPSADNSAEGFQRYLASVQKAAVISDTLAIGADCKTYPVVLKTQEGARLIMKNYDDEPHTITLDTFDGERSFLVPPHESIALSVDFGKSGEMLSLGCDPGSVNAGALLIDEEPI